MSNKTVVITRKGCVIETEVVVMHNGEVHEKITMYCKKPIDFKPR